MLGKEEKGGEGQKNLNKRKKGREYEEGREGGREGEGGGGHTRTLATCAFSKPSSNLGVIRVGIAVQDVGDDMVA
jgi:hypothetical protein